MMRARRPKTALQAPALPFRVGHGFDLHRLAPGLKLIIGGIDIPHEKGCEAHSDGASPSTTRREPSRAHGGPPNVGAGDVLIHCIVDSILGALGLPDIGAPPTPCADAPDIGAPEASAPAPTLSRAAVPGQRRDLEGRELGPLPH